MKPRSALSLLAILALTLACGSGDDGTEEDCLRIGVIPKGTTHVFWKAIHAGAKEAEKDLGVKVIWKGPLREDDRDEQIKVVENLTISGVDGLVVAPLDDTALVPPLKAAADDRDIPVIIIDSDVNWDGRVSFVATDNFKGGVMGAEELARRLGEKGKVLMMRYQEGSASTMKREAGFLETIAKYEGIEVVSSDQYAGATTETAYQTAENLLIHHTELDGIFCPNESSAFGMLRALQDAGRAGKIKYVGFDSSPKLIEALANGEMHGLVLQNPRAMGELGVRSMVEYLEGGDVEPRIDTGVFLATPENMNDEEIQELLSPDLSILED